MRFSTAFTICGQFGLNFGQLWAVSFRSLIFTCKPKEDDKDFYARNVSYLSSWVGPLVLGEAVLGGRCLSASNRPIY